MFHCTTIALVLLFLLPLHGFAQTARQTVSGRVLDATGAPRAGASVTLRRPAVGSARTIASDAAGRFQFHAVDAGRYELSASLPGFSRAVRELVVSAEPMNVDLTLQLGVFTEAVTVLGTRLAGSEETLRRIPGSMDILYSETIETARVFTTSEALRKLPGLTVRDEEGVGLRPNIGVRGMNPTRSTKALLLEDGVPITYAPYGDNASYYHPPIERFDRIELLKGSGQIAYGPVTVGGVVNYITPDPPARRLTTLSVAGGNRGFLTGQVSFGDTWGPTGLFVDVMRKQSDGARENQHSDLNDVTVKLQRQISPTQSLMFKGNYYGEDSQVGYSGLRESEYAENPRQNPFINDDFSGNRGGLSATHRAVLGRRVALTTTGYWQGFRRHWWRQSSNSGQRPNDAADPACGGMTNLNTTCGNEGRLRQYYLFGVEPRARVVHHSFGISQETDLGSRVHGEVQERRQENGATPAARSGQIIEDNRRTAIAVASFIQHRLLLGSWTVTPGIRVEHMQYERTNRLGVGGTDVTGRTSLTEMVPGVGVAYAVRPDTTLFGGAHRGFAPPRVEDVISNTTGSTVELDPERSWNSELGMRSSIRPGLNVSATVFRMDYENQIVAASLAGGVGATLTNGGSTLHQGAEFAAGVDTATLTGTSSGAYARLALTWVPVVKFTGARFSNVSGFRAVSLTGNRLPYAPELLSTATVGFRHQVGLDLQLEAQHLGAQFGDDLNTTAGTADGQRGLIPAHVIWNAAANWRLPARNISVFVAVKNLFDRTFIVDRARGILPSIPRLVQVGASWRLGT